MLERIQYTCINLLYFFKNKQQSVVSSVTTSPNHYSVLLLYNNIHWEQTLAIFTAKSNIIYDCSHCTYKFHTTIYHIYNYFHSLKTNLVFYYSN